ncbi:MAG: hypothetical protein JXC85_04505 [Candidatus Aenigmarchaeota archaeon]|nr:hypothetical protein [Candidatus Aenigmarchaeota archaeon]
MADENKKMDWARIIESQRIESNVDINHTGEGNISRVLGRSIAHAFYRIFYDKIVREPDALTIACVVAVLGFLIFVFAMWLIDSMTSGEAKKPQTEIRYSSSKKETESDYKLCVIDGVKYMLDSDGTVSGTAVEWLWEMFNPAKPPITRHSLRRPPMRATSYSSFWPEFITV